MKMTKKEKEVFFKMKDKAYDDYFSLKNTDDEELKNSIAYGNRLNAQLDIALTFLDLQYALELVR